MRTKVVVKNILDAVTFAVLSAAFYGIVRLEKKTRGTWLGMLLFKDNPKRGSQKK